MTTLENFDPELSYNKTKLEHFWKGEGNWNELKKQWLGHHQ
jgi:hypothetical protein